MDSMERFALSSSMGFCARSDNFLTNLGALIDNDLLLNTKTQSFSLPLIGCLNTSKLIPGFITDIEIDLTLNNISYFILAATTTAASFVTGYSIKNVGLVCEAITLESSGMQQLLAMFPGVFKLKSQSYLYGSSVLGSAALVNVDITYSHSLNSLKQFIWWSSPSDVMEGNYAGVCPNLNTWQLLIGSTAYPQQPVKADRPSECFMQNQKSFGSLYSTSHSGCASRYGFSKASTKGGEYMGYTIRGSTAVDTMAEIVSHRNANKWYQSLDLEIINSLKKTLYTGISTKGSTNTLRLNIGRSLSTTATSSAVHFFSCFDIILEFDYANQIINVIQ
jgi:hypothetical protein